MERSLYCLPSRTWDRRGRRSAASASERIPGGGGRGGGRWPPILAEEISPYQSPQGYPPPHHNGVRTKKAAMGSGPPKESRRQCGMVVLKKVAVTRSRSWSGQICCSSSHGQLRKGAWISGLQSLPHSGTCLTSTHWIWQMCLLSCSSSWPSTWESMRRHSLRVLKGQT